MWDSKDKDGPFGLVSAGFYPVVLKTEQFLCMVGCSPFITFYSFKHKNIRNVFMANKILDPYTISRMETQSKGNRAGAKRLTKYSLCCVSRCRERSVFSCWWAKPPSSRDLERRLWHEHRAFFYSHRRTFKIGHIGENMTFHYSNKWDPACLLLMTSLHTFQIWLVLRHVSNLYSCQCESVRVYAYCLFTVSYV